jgi:sugar phosphate isomerase/epimerase
MPTIGLAPGTGFEIHTLADLDTYLGAVADAGFDAVSLSLNQLAGDPVAASKLLDTHGLRCTDVLSMRITRDEQETMAAARAMAPAVDALGAKHVLAMFWTRLNDESLDRLGRCASVTGAPITLEFGPGGAADTVASTDAFVDLLGIERVSVLADTFHFSRGESTWAMLEAIPLEHLPIIQFTDALPAISDDYMAETTNRRAWPGDGELELTRFASTLLDRGWDGVVSVEVISAELRLLPIVEFARQAYATTAPYWTTQGAF